MSQSIKIATIISYITLILGNLITIIYTPFMLSSLGSSEYGVFSLVNTIIAYMYLLDMGMGSAVIRYNSKYITKNNNEELENINGLFLCIYCTISIVVMICGILIYSKIDIIFSNGLSIYEITRLRLMFIIGVINVFISLPLNVFNGIIISHERFVYVKVIALIRTIINPFIMMIVLLIGYKAVGMIIASTIFNIVLGLINILYCIKKLNVKFKINKFKREILKEVLSYSFYIFLGGMAYNIFWSTDQIILGIFASSSSIAIYSIGSQFNSYYISFSNVICGMYLPKITRMFCNNENEYKNELMEIILKVSRIQFYIATLILMGFILVGRQFILLWAGSEYTTSYYMAVLIMIPQVISIMQSIFVTVLEAMNRHKVKSFIYLGVSFINFIITLILVNKYEIIGCALGTAIGMIINALLNNLYYKYKLKFNMNYYWYEILKLIPSTIISFFIGVFLMRKVIINNYFSIVIFALFFTFIYITICWIFTFNKYEKDLLYSILKKLQKTLKNTTV